jgi:preprotein translocase subunit SecE
MPDSHNELMAATWTKRQRLLRTIVIVSIVILALDIILLNVLGEAVGDWWTLLVGFGLYVVGTVAIVSLVWLLVDRSRTA